MAGLDPAIHVYLSCRHQRRGCPGQPGHDGVISSSREFHYMSLRLIFMGTPDFAVPTLLELVAHGHEIAAVYTRAAIPGGRGMKLQPSPVEVEATRLNIPVLTPWALKTPEAVETFRA